MTVGTAARLPGQGAVRLGAVRGGALAGLATAAYLVLLACFALLAVQAAFLVRESRQVHHGMLLQLEEWRGTPRLSLGYQGPARLYQPLAIPGPDFPGVRPSGTEAKFDLPYRPEGYVLLFGVVEGDGHGPATIRLTMDDALLREVHVVPPPTTEGFGRMKIEKLVLPASALEQSEEGSTLRLLTVAGEYWEGSLALVPNPARYDLLRFAIPILGGLVLAVAAWRQGKRPTWWLFPLIPVVTFVVYGFTFFPWTVAPMNGLLFADTWDYAAASLGWKGTAYVERHPLFLPIVRDIVIVLHRTRFGEVTVPQMAFALIAAGNALLAYLVCWRWLRHARLAAVLLLVYAFSFSTWVYSAVFETYMFSTAMLHLFLLALPGFRRVGRLWRELATGAAALASSLAFPPLLALLGLLGVRMLLIARRSPRLAVGPLLGIALTVVGYGVVQAALKAYFAEEASAAGASVGSVLRSNLGVIERFASVDHLTAPNLANVLLQQFAYAIGGHPYPFDFGQGPAGVLEYFRSAWGLLFLVGWLAVLAGTVKGLARDGRLRRPIVVAALVTGAPFFGFLWYLNPTETLLYSAHMVLPTLLLCALAWRTWQPSRRVQAAFAGLAALVLLNNLPALASYV